MTSQESAGASPRTPAVSIGAHTGALQRQVPVRTILTTIGLVLATVVAVLFVMQVERVLVWMVVALFFTVALYPVVAWLQRRVVHRRSLATLLVFLVALLIIGGLLAAFAVPLAQEGTQLAGQLPALINDARSGRGPVGDLLERTNALQWVQNNEDRIREFATGLGTPALTLVQGASTAVVATVTIFVLSYLAVLEGPKVVTGTLNLFPPQRAERIRRVTRDCAKTVTGYISGNLLISVICGVLTYAVLKIFGVPFAGLIALFVAIVDLIPLVGATLGAVVATIAGFVHSVPAGIAVIVFFVLYQQLENHVLQPLIFARTVKLNPLAVLVAILLAVELAGVLGALLAIPVAGIIQVVLRDLWDHRRGRPKDEPTIGEDHTPVDHADDPADGDQAHPRPVGAGSITAPTPRFTDPGNEARGAAAAAVADVAPLLEYGRITGDLPGSPMTAPSGGPGTINAQGCRTSQEVRSGSETRPVPGAAEQSYLRLRNACRSAARAGVAIT